MPMVWNADADAKLLLGVLAQFKPLKSKLDYEALAAYMGPDCTPCAIENRLVRLRRQVESVSFGSSTPKATPSSTPRKRKPVATPRTPGKKAKGKAKETMPAEDDSETEIEEEAMKMEIKDEGILDKIKEEHEEA